MKIYHLRKILFKAPKKANNMRLSDLLVNLQNEKTTELLTFDLQFSEIYIPPTRNVFRTCTNESDSIAAIIYTTRVFLSKRIISLHRFQNHLTQSVQVHVDDDFILLLIKAPSSSIKSCVHPFENSFKTALLEYLRHEIVFLSRLRFL